MGNTIEMMRYTERAKIFIDIQKGERKNLND